MEKRECRWDQVVFTPDHKNQIYCCDACYDAAKAKRQKQKRDPVKNLILILMSNHERIDNAYKDGKLELDLKAVEAYDIDLSLSRRLQPPSEFAGKRMLDFGMYFLITDNNFQTFKIFKHGTEHTI